MRALFVVVVALFVVHDVLALRVEPLHTRRSVLGAAAGATALGNLPAAFAERNVVTKEEAAEMKANMITRDYVAGEDTAESIALQEERRKRYAEVKAKKAAFEGAVVAVESSKTADAFVEAANALGAEVTRLERVPEGVKIAEIVKRLRVAFNGLPQKQIKCSDDVRPGVKCYTAGTEAEAAYERLVIILKKASAVDMGGGLNKVYVNAF